MDLIAGKTDAELAALLANALITANEAKWRDGQLRDLLDPTQCKLRDVREAMWAKQQLPAKTRAEQLRRASIPVGFFELCARETGKTFEFLTLAQEVVRRKPNALAVIIRGRRDDAEKVARDIMPMVEKTCPESQKLIWSPGDGEFRHPTNGSAIRFRGTEAEQRGRLRGFGFDLAVLDEVAEIDDLPAVLAIVEPLVLRLNGKLVLATTPAEVQGHASEMLYEEYAGRGASCLFTLLDNGRLTWEEKAKRLLSGTDAEAIEDVEEILAGTKDCKKTRNLREWWCRFVSESSQLIHPKWAGVRDECTVQVER